MPQHYNPFILDVRVVTLKNNLVKCIRDNIVFFYPIESLLEVKADRMKTVFGECIFVDFGLEAQENFSGVAAISEITLEGEKL